MKNRMILVVSLALAALAGVGAASADPTVEECKAPFRPAMTVPSGGTATNEELQALFDSVKRFQGQLEKYRACLDGKMTAAKEAEDKEALAALTEQYNASVDAEEGVVSEFNEVLKACRAANTCPKDA